MLFVYESLGRTTNILQKINSSQTQFIEKSLISCMKIYMGQKQRQNACRAQTLDVAVPAICRTQAYHNNNRCVMLYRAKRRSQFQVCYDRRLTVNQACDLSYRIPLVIISLQRHRETITLGILGGNLITYRTRTNGLDKI